MAGEPVVTIIGNVAGEPQLRFSPGGVAVLNFTLANTPRNKDRQSDQWVDGETMWVRVTAFRKDAENAAESLQKGTRVIATGRLSQEVWTDKEGQERTSLKLLADEIGASMKFATLEVKKAARGSEAPRRQAEPEFDPWATAPADEEIPF